MILRVEIVVRIFSLHTIRNSKENNPIHYKEGTQKLLVSAAALLPVLHGVL